MILKKRIRIKLESFNSKNLNKFSDYILNFIKNESIIQCESKITCIPLPTNRRVYCVLRSPHSDKDSREHFEIKVYKKLVHIQNNNLDVTLKKLLNLNLPADILCKINLI
jgi:small subunit ribosomal protein S10